MRQTFISLALVLSFFLALITGCQKNGSDAIAEPRDSLAIFKIVVLESGCPAITKNGVFLTETGLGLNENIKAEVDVIKPGKWEYGTDTLNGFSFSASGTFVNTGRQEIILNGNGTPISAGNYRFLIDTSGYTSSISVLENNVQEETVEVASYFKGTIDGVDYDSELLDGPDNVPYSSSAGVDRGFGSHYDGASNLPAPDAGILSLQKDFIYNYSESTEADFFNFFSVGAYPYKEFWDLCLPISDPGVILTWSYVDGDSWMTISGSREQEGSSFEIIGAEDGHTTNGRYYVKVKSRFNCKLYNQRTGQMKLLTNGEMVSYFIRPV